MLLEGVGGGVPVALQGRLEDLQMLLAGLLPVDHAHLAGHDAEPGVQAGDAVIGRAHILVGQGAHEQLVEVIVGLAEILDAIGLVHHLDKVLQLPVGDVCAIGAQGIRLHQQTHLEHTVHIVLGDAGDHQPLLGQDGDQALLFQTPQRIPHGGAADVAHLRAELLLVQELVRAVLTVEDLGLQVLIRLQLQAQLCLCFRLFHLPLLQSFPAGRSTRGLPVLLVSLKQSNYSLDFIITQ